MKSSKSSGREAQGAWGLENGVNGESPSVFLYVNESLGSKVVLLLLLLNCCSRLCVVQMYRWSSSIIYIYYLLLYMNIYTAVYIYTHRFRMYSFFCLFSSNEIITTHNNILK